MNQDRTWLVSVLFLDIFKFSTIPVDQQLKVKRHFQGLVSIQIASLDDGDTIRLDTGDGMAICYLGDPERLYPIARNLRDAFISQADSPDCSYKVRLGLNLGPVKIVEDLNHKRNSLGSGITDAERVMSFAAENQLLVSKSYFEMVNKLSQDYSRELQHLRLRANKHHQQHDIYELAVELVRVNNPNGAFTSSPAAAPSGSLAEPKFDPEAIKKISHEYAMYISRAEGERILQQTMQQASTLKQLCELLLKEIKSADDRYSFDPYLKSYGYSGYQ
ncbi:MAG: hypothetical protein H8E21_05210 [Gammaproteobacteria bacterium]|nr:hypothetical protein [Gammaproteobacteria bacterium]